MNVRAGVILAVALLDNDRSIRGMGNPRGSFHSDGYFRRADAVEEEEIKDSEKQRVSLAKPIELEKGRAIKPTIRATRHATTSHQWTKWPI